MEKEDKKYIVKAYSVGGRNNRVYRSKEEVLASNFPDGNAEKLEEQGFLVAVKSKAKSQDKSDDSKSDDSKKSAKGK